MLDVLMTFLRPSGQYAARDAWEAAQKLSHADSALDQLFPPEMDDEDAYILLVLTASRMRMRGMAPSRIMRVMAAVYDMPSVVVPIPANGEPLGTQTPQEPETTNLEGADGGPLPSPNAREAQLRGCVCEWDYEIDEVTLPVNPACPVHGDKETTH